MSSLCTLGLHNTLDGQLVYARSFFYDVIYGQPVYASWPLGHCVLEIPLNGCTDTRTDGQMCRQAFSRTAKQAYIVRERERERIIDRQNYRQTEM